MLEKTESETSGVFFVVFFKKGQHRRNNINKEAEVKRLEEVLPKHAITQLTHFHFF